MKKSTAAILCASALSLSLLAGCATTGNGTDTDVTPDPDVTPVTDAEPDATPVTDVDDGEMWKTPEATGEKKTVSVDAEGEKNEIEMNQYLCQTNGATFKLFFDDTRYKARNFEGEIDIFNADATDDVFEGYIHFSYANDKTADVMAEEALQDTTINVTDGGMVKLGEYDAYCVKYDGETDHGAAYFIAVENGTLFCRIYADGFVPEVHMSWLTAALSTISDISPIG